MARYFILRGEDVIEEPDYSVWAEWYEALYENVRSIASDQLHHSTLSTDFLAMSMGLNTGAPPLIFETRVRGGWLDDESERYATLDEARQGHERWLERIKVADEENELPPPGAGW